MTYDASNRKDIRRAEKDARAAEVARVDYLKAAMTVSQGRAWFHDLLEFCGCFRGDVSFAENQDYFALGMRNVGLRMFNDITTHCPDDFVTMMKESHGRRISIDTNSRSGTAELSGSTGTGRDVEGSDLNPADYNPYDPDRDDI